MKFNKSGSFELSEAEAVVADWYEDQMSMGKSQAEAVKYIEDSVPIGGFTQKLLQDPAFRAYLLS